MPISKHVSQSKTIWVGALVSLLAFLWPGLDDHVTLELAVFIEAALFMALRLVTNTAVHLR